METNASKMAEKLFGRQTTDTGAMPCPEVMTKFPSSTPVGMMYVPYQMWEEPYEPDVAISRGTIFASLDLPFLAGKEAERRGDV